MKSTTQNGARMYVVAFSYKRFSSSVQEHGDSIRRQDDLAEQWCTRNNVPLDTTLDLSDRGVSAFTGEHRKNPDRHALAMILRWIESGRIQKCDYLLIENLDRLSREEEVPATHLLLSILMSGVHVVQLSPHEMTLTDKTDAFGIMRAVMELSRGHGESSIKSKRIGAAWAANRQKTRDTGAVLTHRLPAWIEERNGKLVLIPERAAVIRQIYALARNGYGFRSTVKKLTEDGVPAFGERVPVCDESGKQLVDRRGFLRWRAAPGERIGSGSWTLAYVAAILRDRRAMGEFQPRLLREDCPDGPPISKYYPAAVTEQEWLAARAGATHRLAHRGRISAKRVNIFSHLTKDAKTGSTYYAVTRTYRAYGGLPARSKRVLQTAEAREGRRGGSTFCAASFEQSILSFLSEISPAEVLDTADEPDNTTVLAGQLGTVEQRLAELEKELATGGEVAAAVRVMRQLEERKRSLSEELAKARQVAAHPLSEAWGEAKPLLKALEHAPDPEAARMRLRAIMQRIVAEIRILIVHRKPDQIAAVQIWFASSNTHRDYLIVHRPGRRSSYKINREAKCWTRSLSKLTCADDMDLRDREQALRLERVLEECDVQALIAEPQKQTRRRRALSEAS